MTNAPKDFDLARELAETADWDETPAGHPDRDGRPALAADPTA